MPEIFEIDKPFRELSYGLLASEVKLLGTSINRPFALFTNRSMICAKIFSRQNPWLARTENILKRFKQDIDTIDKIEDLYINIRDAHGRTPTGYIIDLQVIIPDSNREIEYSIYSAFGKLLRTSSPLLFDLHIIKLKGRTPDEVIPKGFWRYGWTSNYIS